MRQQKTIGKKFTLTGHGLHTGKEVVLNFKPAPADTGIRFVRTDLNPRVEIPANASAVTTQSAPSRNTQLAAGGVVINTVEHLLAACYGLEIDNLTVEISADEPPEPEDGNYRFFTNPLEDAGSVGQGVPCRPLKIGDAVSYRDGDVEIVATPADTFRASFTIQFDNPYIG
ncbi:MAG: UDP-3-O-acyl-N-acetylglucosamine deacetylase, partial [Candidatus Latescibacterota bacterium]